MKALYCIPKLDQINKYLEFAETYNAGFEYNDFFIPAVLDNEEQVNKLINSYLEIDRDRSEDTLHGVFLDICVHSADSLIYKASDYRIHQSMDIATKLGLKAVIFHTNQIPNFKLQSYLDGWVDLNEKYWRNLLKEYPNLEVYIENMFDLDSGLLRQLAERMNDEPRFGVCFDFAHAFISDEAIKDWCSSLGPYIKHLHINDNNGIEDTHNPVGLVDIPWNVYSDYINSLEPSAKPTVLIEVRGFDDLEASVEYMKKHKMYPF